MRYIKLTYLESKLTKIIESQSQSNHWQLASNLLKITTVGVLQFLHWEEFERHSEGEFIRCISISN